MITAVATGKSEPFGKLGEPCEAETLRCVERSTPAGQDVMSKIPHDEQADGIQYDRQDSERLSRCVEPSGWYIYQIYPGYVPTRVRAVQGIATPQ